MQALYALFDRLPADTGASFIVVQHLSFEHPSVLHELLDRRTDMPVTMLSKSITCRPNHVYVVPGTAYAALRGNAVFLTAPPQGEIHLDRPIDRFFTSLAENKDGFSVAVVLSGTGSDGSRGAQIIKEVGGMVLVQDPSDAEFDGMPRAVVDLKLADVVLPLDQLGTRLTEILAVHGKMDQARAELDLEEPASRILFEQIIERVGETAHISFENYRTPTLLRRLEKRMLLQKITRVSDYIDVLEQNDDEIQSLRNDFLIGVTQFFRDRPSFDDLYDRGLPVLVENYDGNHEGLRIWVAACSTGEEAYSVAILIEEYLKEHQLNIPFRVYATDLNDRAIDSARRAIYPVAAQEDIPTEWFHRYFRRVPEGIQVSLRLRNKVFFAVQDLLSDPPFIRMDLICCRNFLIYIKSEAQNRILSTFHYALRSSAVLMLGPSESLGTVKPGFERLSRRWNVFRKNGAIPQRELRTIKRIGRPRIPTPPEGAKNTTALKLTTPTFQPADPFTGYMVETYAPTHLFINKELDVLYSHGATDRFMRLPRAVPRFNLRHMMSPELMRTFEIGAKKALETTETQILRNVQLQEHAESLRATLRFRCVEFEDLPDPAILVTILFHDEAEAPEDDSAQEVNPADARIRSLEADLRQKRKETQRLIQELESTNEELQSSNRELLASNEEMQSTNEELQSVNEELYTVNTELQAKNEELTVLNTDLDNLLKSTEIGTIFLDRKLSIRRFTPAVTRQFDLVETDVGRSILSFANNLDGVDLQTVADEIFENNQPIERRIRDRQGSPYLLRVHPYDSDRENPAGLVMTFVDISELTEAQREKRELSDLFQSVVDLSDHLVIVIDAQSLQVQHANRPIGLMSAQKAVGHPLTDQLEKTTAENLREAARAVRETGVFQNVTLEFKRQPNRKVCDIYNVSMVPYRSDAILNADQEPDRLLLLARNVTTELLPHINMETKREVYGSFMARARRQIALVDEELNLVAINHTRYSSLSMEDITGTPILKYLPEYCHDDLRAAVERVFAGEENVSFTMTYDLRNHPEGPREMHVEQVLTPVRVRQEIVYVAMVGHRVDSQN